MIKPYSWPRGGRGKITPSIRNLVLFFYVFPIIFVNNVKIQFLNGFGASRTGRKFYDAFENKKNYFFYQKL